MTTSYDFVPHRFERRPEADMRSAGERLLADLLQRRSVRRFSDDPVPRELVELAIRAAHSAPSGANRQPWHFVAVNVPATKL